MARTHRFTVFALLCITLVTLTTPLLAQGNTRYHITGLGYIGTEELYERHSRAVAINNSGQMAGQSTKSNSMGDYVARATSSGMTLLPAVGGSQWGMAKAISGNGQRLAGYVTGGLGQRAAYWYNTSGYDLGTLEGTTDSRANGVNSSGMCVGFSGSSGSGIGHAVVWPTRLTITDLGDGEAYAVNNSGWVVGRGAGTGGAFLWRQSLGTTSLGVLPGFSYSTASDVNESGVVVGTSFTSASRAFVWDETNGMRDLGTLAGGSGYWGKRINGNGMVLGSYTGSASDQRNFLWTSSGGMVDMTSLIDLNGWTSVVVEDINDFGQICGWGMNPQGDLEEAFLLTPYVIPEPSSLLALAGGLIGLISLRRRTR